MLSEKPERIRWAVEVLSVNPKENVLEIGCGNGHAVELICKRLTTGKIVGIDRSAKAILSAKANNQLYANSSKARFVNSALADIKLNEWFDKVFAINVNVFWIDPRSELSNLHNFMKRSSQLYLFYEPPPSQLEKIIENSAKFLEAENFKDIEVIRKKLTSKDNVCIKAKK